jgi:ABC-2 type transport system permease protein
MTRPIIFGPLAQSLPFSAGIFVATVARSMPQFGMLLVLVLLPLQRLSGSITPRESMPKFVQDVMLAAPTTHFVELGQAILWGSTSRGGPS